MKNNENIQFIILVVSMILTFIFIFHLANIEEQKIKDGLENKYKVYKTYNR